MNLPDFEKEFAFIGFGLKSSILYRPTPGAAVALMLATDLDLGKEYLSPLSVFNSYVPGPGLNALSVNSTCSASGINAVLECLGMNSLTEY